MQSKIWSTRYILFLDVKDSKNGKSKDIGLDTPDKQEDNCLQPACMNLYHLISQLRQFIKIFSNSIIDGADRIENVCSIDVTPRIKRGITVCSPPV